MKFFSILVALTEDDLYGILKIDKLRQLTRFILMVIIRILAESKHEYQILPKIVFTRGKCNLKI